MAKMLRRAARKGCRCCDSMHNCDKQAKRQQRAQENETWKRENGLL